MYIGVYISTDVLPYIFFTEFRSFGELLSLFKTPSTLSESTRNKLGDSSRLIKSTSLENSL